jgi:hypothetical protein
VQIIALTTQISELKNEFSKVKIVSKSYKKTLTPGTDNSSNTKPWGNFELWRLTKVNNGAEFNMVEKDGKKLYWCNQHQYPGNATKRMYVFHKPTDHDLWAAKKADFKKKKGNRHAKIPNLTPPAASTLNPQAATKLSLAKSLQEALTTTAGLSKDRFSKIWDKCCNDLGD